MDNKSRNDKLSARELKKKTRKKKNKRLNAEVLPEELAYQRMVKNHNVTDITSNFDSSDQ